MKMAWLTDRAGCKLRPLDAEEEDIFEIHYWLGHNNTCKVVLSLKTIFLIDQNRPKTDLFQKKIKKLHQSHTHTYFIYLFISINLFIEK